MALISLAFARFLFTRCVTWPGPGSPFMQVSTEAIYDFGAYVFTEVNSASIKITRHTPLDFCRALALSPITHKAFCVGCITRRSFSACNHFTPH